MGQGAAGAAPGRGKGGASGVTGSPPMWGGPNREPAMMSGLGAQVGSPGDPGGILNGRGPAFNKGLPTGGAEPNPGLFTNELPMMGAPNRDIGMARPGGLVNDRGPAFNKGLPTGGAEPMPGFTNELPMMPERVQGFGPRRQAMWQQRVAGNAGHSVPGAGLRRIFGR